MQNVSDAPPDVNVQHWLLIESVQSALTWQSWTFDASEQVVPKCVVHALAVVHDVPSADKPHCGYVPVPSGVSTPQHTGAALPHDSGPSHVIWSAEAQLAVPTHPNVVVAPGIAQHTSLVMHAALPAQPNG